MPIQRLFLGKGRKIGFNKTNEKAIIGVSIDD